VAPALATQRGGGEGLAQHGRGTNALARVLRRPGDEQGGDRPPAANHFHRGDAASFGEPDVGGDQVRAAHRRGGDRFGFGRGELDAVIAAQAQAILDQHGDQRLVFDDQGVHRIHPASGRERDVSQSLKPERISDEIRMPNTPSKFNPG
jgi:hypothetical protein